MKYIVKILSIRAIVFFQYLFTFGFCYTQKKILSSKIKLQLTSFCCFDSRYALIFCLICQFTNEMIKKSRTFYQTHLYPIFISYYVVIQNSNYEFINDSIYECKINIEVKSISTHAKLLQIPYQNQHIFHMGNSSVFRIAVVQKSLIFSFPIVAIKSNALLLNKLSCFISQIDFIELEYLLEVKNFNLPDLIITHKQNNPIRFDTSIYCNHFALFKSNENKK